MSPNTRAATEIVRTSLKIPQILKVTTEVRWMRANSEAVIRNARQPGKRRIRGARMKPCLSPSLLNAWYMSPRPSTGRARMNSVTNMTGARKKIDENGFDVAGCRMRRI